MEGNYYSIHCTSDGNYYALKCPFHNPKHEQFNNVKCKKVSEWHKCVLVDPEFFKRWEKVQTEFYNMIGEWRQLEWNSLRQTN